MESAQTNGAHPAKRRGRPPAKAAAGGKKAARGRPRKNGGAAEPETTRSPQLASDVKTLGRDLHELAIRTVSLINTRADELEHASMESLKVIATTNELVRQFGRFESAVTGVEVTQ